MFIRKRDKIYADLADKYKINRRVARKIAHHPFSVLHEIAYDPLNHRPLRLRYLGVFYVNPTYKKQMAYAPEDGYPEEGRRIYARVKMLRPNKERRGVYLLEGTVENGTFKCIDGTREAPISSVYYWVYADTLVE